MRKIRLLLIIIVIALLTNCGKYQEFTKKDNINFKKKKTEYEYMHIDITIKKLKSGLLVMKFESDDKFENFLNYGKAKSDQEILNLRKQYDFHVSIDYIIHFTISNQTGGSVAIEYINNRMIVINTNIFKNFT